MIMINDKNKDRMIKIKINDNDKDQKCVQQYKNVFSSIEKIKMCLVVLYVRLTGQYFFYKYYKRLKRK